MWSNIIQLVVVMIVFVLILIAAYFTTRWVGKSGTISGSAKNIQIIETYKISQTKYIQLVRIGSKYCAVGISKDSMTMLTELDEDQLDLSEVGSVGNTVSFKDFYDKMIRKDKDHKKIDNKKKD